jgi:hypothetical protein
VAAFTEPEKHVGQTYTLTGESVTEKQVAETISKIIGKPVTHVNLSPEEYGALITQVTGRKELGGRDLHAAAAAQPPSRSIHNTTPHSSSNSSSRRSTQAFTELGPRRRGGIVDNIPAAAPAAPPPRRSTHKFIHFYQNTSLYGAWQK